MELINIVEFLQNTDNHGKMVIKTEEVKSVVDKVEDGVEDVPVLDGSSNPVIDENGKAVVKTVKKYKEVPRTVQFLYTVQPDLSIKKEPVDVQSWEREIAKKEQELAQLQSKHNITK